MAIINLNPSIKPMDTVILPPEEDRQWAQVVGSLILHFGTLEYLTFIFIELFSGAAARDAAQKDKFAKRIRTVKELIEKSSWSESQKNTALDLWIKVDGHREFRNEVAHNPFIIKRIADKNVMGILNVRHLRGPGPYTPPLISLNDVILIYNKIGELVLALNAVIKPG